MSHQSTKTIVITGGSGGIGYQSALGLAQTGARVLIVGRNQKRGEDALRSIQEQTGNQDILFVKGDLSSITSINSLVLALQKHLEHIDVLINNAGYLGSEYCQNEDGLEMHFAVNVFAPYYLTHRLLPQLKATKHARVLNISGGDKPARIDVDNLQAEKGFKGLMTYTHSKSILEAMSMSIAAELKSMGIHVHVIFPGRASTAMTRSLTPQSLPGVMKIMYPIFRLLFKDDGGKGAKKASKSKIWGATSPDLAKTTGAYFDSHCIERDLHPTAYDKQVHAQIHSVMDHAKNQIKL